MEYPEYIQRMIKEKDELYDKTARCLDFILDEKFTELNKFQKELLIKQHDYMCNYLIVLKTRINNEIELLNAKKND